MSRCLGERTLWRLHHGDDDSGAHRAHLAACRHCAARYQGLGRDLDLIAETLQALPPMAVTRRRPAGLGLRRVALAAGLATLLLVAGVQTWRGRADAPRPGPAPAPVTEEALAFLDEVSAVLWSAGAGGEWPDPGEDPALVVSTGPEFIRSSP